MKKKLFIRLCFLLVIVLLSFNSCIGEDIMPVVGKKSSFQTLSARGPSKSLWHEDNLYIDKVRSVYARYSNEAYITKNYGTIFWEYAMTMETVGEKYLIVPIIKDGKVVAEMEAFRVKGSVYFRFSKEDKEGFDFFQTLYNLKPTSIVEVSSSGRSEAKSGITIRVSVCRTIKITYGPIEGSPGDELPIETTKTICKFVDQMVPESECLGDVNPETGECGGGGSGGGGYPYPEPPEEVDPCEKIKTIGKDSKTKALFQNLKAKTNSTKEFGEILIDNGSGIDNLPVEGVVGVGGININYSGSQIDGFIHSHFAGLYSIFSPGDLASLSSIYANNGIKNINTFVFGLVTASNTQYIMVIDDPVKFATFAQQFLLPDGTIDKTSSDLFGLVDYHKYNIKENNISPTNELGFIQLLLDKNAGLKVLKGSNNSNDWAELNIKNGVIDPKPCN